MSDLTIIYYTDHTVKDPLKSACRNHLKKIAKEIPIVSVSHRQIDLGENIAIGAHKRSWLLLYRQLYIGVEAAKTKYIGCCEHDCFYSKEHWLWEPPRDDVFYYNENHWLVQYAEKSHSELKGMYSRYWKQRLALSQMICNRDLLLQTLDERLNLLDKDHKLVRNLIYAGEPGLSKLRIEKARKYAKSGRPVYLKKYIKDHLDKEKYDVFRTKIPNLDVRHDSNFTGPKRGKKRRWKIKYWGKFEDLINGEQ